MPNDTVCKAVDLAVCGTLKAGIDTPLVKWTVQFLRYLLDQAEKSKKFVVVFAHSQGAIYLEHALDSNWKHEFISNCYQAKIKDRVDTYKGM